MQKPQPRITDVNKPFWDGCNQGRLVIQRCQNEACGRAVFYPRVCCPHCQGGSLEWVEASGRGCIISHTSVHRPHHDGFAAEAPYVFAAIELEEGPCVYAQLPDAPTNHKSLIGHAVMADFVPHGPDLKMAIFRLCPPITHEAGSQA